MKKLGVLFMTVLLGAAPLSARAAEVTVSAAASLADAFNELGALFEKSHPGVTYRSNYAASNPLLRQIEAGAPVDVFASADLQTMDKAEAAKAVNPATRKTFALNDLVVIVPKGSPKPANFADLPNFRRVAIGNPDSVPAGRYSRDAMKSAGIWDKITPNLIQGASVRQVLDYVARGEVDAGLVYRTDALNRKDKVDIALVAEGHEPVSYPIAVALTGSNAAVGQEFLDFVLSPEGKAVLEKYGFSIPAEK